MHQQQILDATGDPVLAAELLFGGKEDRRQVLKSLIEAGCSDEVLGEAVEMRKSLVPRDGDGDGMVYDGTENEQSVAVIEDESINPKILNWAVGKWGGKMAPDGSSVAENFARWFGNSKIVDQDGFPLLCYHGTDSPEAFNEFEPKASTAVYRHKGEEIPVVDYWDVGDDGTGEPEKFINHALVDLASLGGAQQAFEFRMKEQSKYGEATGKTKRIIGDLKRLAEMGVTKLEQTYEKRPSGDGSWFTPNLGYNFINNQVAESGGRIYPVYLKVENPTFVSVSEVESAGRAHRIGAYRSEGYDGVIGLGKPDGGMADWGWNGATQIVVFGSKQVKSAAGNDGSFSSSPDITKSSKWSGLRSEPRNDLIEKLICTLNKTSEMLESREKSLVRSQSVILKSVAEAAKRQSSEVVGVAKSLNRAVEILSHRQPITVNVPEIRPIVNVTVPEPSSVVVKLPEQPVVVNVQVPEQLPPNVNVNVEPAKVDLKLDVQAVMPPRNTETVVQRDANNLISRVTQIERSE